jgi:hypothetical protein
MGNVFRFPEPAQKPSKSGRECSEIGELVPIRGGSLEATLEMVGFLRSLANQSYLDRFNRVQSSAGGGQSADAPQAMPEERR